MPFLKRLGFYLIGLSVGIVFLAIFLKKKTDETGTQFCYFPNCRVLKELRSKPLAYSENIRQLLDTGEIDSLDIMRFLTEGDVDFERSDTGAKPCRSYFIVSEHRKKTAQLKVSNCPEEVRVEHLDQLHAGN